MSCLVSLLRVALVQAVVSIAVIVAASAGARAQIDPSNPYGMATYDWGKNLTADEVSRFVKFWDKVSNLSPVQVAAMKRNDWAGAMVGTAWATELQTLGYTSERFWQVFYRSGMMFGWLDMEKKGEDPYAQWAEMQKSIKEAANNPQIPAEYRQTMQAQATMVEKLKPEKAEMDLVRPHYDRLKRIFKQIDDKFGND